MPEGDPAKYSKHGGAPPRLVIWRFSDGKAGHDNQSLGLAEALAREVECEIHSVTLMSAPAAVMCLVKGQTAPFNPHPNPALILGAGHATHLSMLAARRSRGGRVVVLMTPTLPKGLFDLCLIPEHDRPRGAANLVLTRGALNRVRPCADKDASSGLILLGGPSPHFAFETQKVLDQIEAILKSDSTALWTATASRRTPSNFIASLRALDAANLEVVPAEETAVDWLADRLGRTTRVWVTEDSASMVYEALSGGAAVGLLMLQAKRPGRLSRGVEQLAEDDWVTRFDQWANGKILKKPKAALNESERCAKLILNRWPNLTSD